jgi:hypothetical protein
MLCPRQPLMLLVLQLPQARPLVPLGLVQRLVAQQVQPLPLWLGLRWR